MKNLSTPLILALTLFSSSLTLAQVNPSDSLELVDFYNSTCNDGCTINWDFNEPVEDWTGIFVTDNKVIYITLSNRGLSGNLPDLNLPDLTYLSLHDNQLTGSIPDFTNTPNLSHLSLRNNQLSGCFDAFLINLCDITYYDFNNNPDLPWNGNFSYFCESGETICQVSVNPSDSLALVDFYDSACKEGCLLNWDFNEPVEDWTGITIAGDRVRSIFLRFKKLNGSVPNLNLPELVYFDLSGNELIDTIPNFDSLPSLKRLWLTQNNLIGSIPNFVNLSNLTQLDLGDNNLSGNIPYFPNLPDLIQLRLHMNNIEGTISEFGNLPKLKDLTLARNNLSGIIPSCDSLPDLEWLFLGENDLSGSIPDFELPNLEWINLHSSGITGDIPSFEKTPKLRTIVLSNNQLEGNIPVEIGKLYNIEYIFLSNNQLNGSIPYRIGYLPNLLYLWLDNNQLEGCYPSSLTNLCSQLDSVKINDGNNFNAIWEGFCDNGDGICETEDDSLELINLYNATDGTNWAVTWDLTQPMSTWYGVTLNASGRVSQIDLSNNNLVGIIPDLDLYDLTHLFLQNNYLTGDIPNFGFLYNLLEMNLSNNQLSGSIKDLILPNIRQLILSHNSFGESNRLENILANIPSTLQILELEYTGIGGQIPNYINSHSLQSLDVEGNSIGGVMPEFLISPVLQVLDIKRNNISGTMPSLMSLSLKEIDVSHNYLSDTIPDYSMLSNLLKVKLNNNNFEHSHISANFSINNTIDSFVVSPQYYGNEQFKTGAAVDETVVLSPSPSIPYQNPEVRWLKDGNFITNHFVLNDTTYIIESITNSDIGLYEYWFKDETLIPVVEFRSRPINNQIEGLDLNGEPVIAGELIVEFGEEMSDEAIISKRDELRNTFGGTLLGSCGCHKEIDLWRFESAADVDTVRSFLNGKAEKHALDTESDGGLNRTNIATPSYINDQKFVVSNHDEGTGTDNEVVITVIDTGVLTDHISIQSALKVNENEIPNNNTDDDGNGHVDDIYGIDIIDSLAMSDPNGHGTFVAGTITANIPAGHNIKVMLARAFDEQGRGELFDIICSIYYAADNGADIISMSANYKGEMSQALKNSIQYAGTQGIMFVCSSGNDTTNLDQVDKYRWPVHFSTMSGINNVIAVTALNNKGELLYGANYSDTIVTIAALGEGIYAPSNLDSEHYDYITGTSVSAPFVALALGIEKSRNPDRPLPQWKSDFLNSERVESVPELTPYVQGGRMLKIEKSKVDIETFSVNVLLEGAMIELNGDNLLLPMRTDLNQRGLLPGQTLVGVGTPTPPEQPYNDIDTTFCYLGGEGNNISYGPNIVDWVMVSLREEINSTEIYRTVGLLKNDGNVIFLRPITTGLIDVPDSVYIVIEHRNHLSVMSHEKVPIINNTIVYDFTTQDSYRDITSFGQLQTSNGFWYMIGANGYHEDDQPSSDIQGNDKTEWSNDNGKFNIYLYSDYNMDGDINGEDRFIWERHNGKSNRVIRLSCYQKYQGN